MARRGENIYKRKDGRWEGRYARGRRADGTIHYGYVYGKSYKETRQKLMPLKYKYVRDNQDAKNFDGDFTEWVAKWLEEEVRGQVKISTFASYQYKLQKYVIPVLGEYKITEITPDLIQELVDLWEQSWDLSPSTIHVAFRILQKSLRYAKTQKILLINVCEDVRLPTKKKLTIRALNRAEQKQLEDVAKQNIQGLPILIALHTGLRMGEIAALTWENIDLENQLIRVTHTYQRIPLQQEQKTMLVMAEAKTASSQRVVPMTDQLCEQLEKWADLQKGKYLFGKWNRPMEPRVMTYHFKRIVQEANLEGIHFHQLRHTFATRYIEAKGDIASVSAMLGHSSAKTTLDIYVDSLLDQRRTMVMEMEKQLLA